MSKANTIKFNGSQFLVEIVGQKPASLARSGPISFSGASATNPGSITVANNSQFKGKAGDIAIITNAGDLDGEYILKSVTFTKIEFASDWTNKTIPKDFSAAKIAIKSDFTDKNFCELKSIQKSGSSIEQVDISTICSVDGKDYAPGDREEGTLTLTFFLDPDSPTLQMLEKYEFSQEKFWSKVIFPNSRGQYLFYGSVETGLNLDGQVGGRWDSGCAIRLSGRSVLITEQA